jgi:hypothetical protein
MSESYVRWGRNDGVGGATEEMFHDADDADALADQLREELDRDTHYVTVQHTLGRVVLERTPLAQQAFERVVCRYNNAPHTLDRECENVRYVA